MEILKGWYKRFFGKNEGLELIASRLRNGVPYVKAFNSSDQGMIYFKGTGQYLSGMGNVKTYDVHYQVLNVHNGWETTLSNWRPVADSKWLYAHLEDLDSSDLCDLRDQVGDNDPEEVIAWLGKIASRLKPFQSYTLDMVSITNELFAGDAIRVYSGKKEILVPREYIGNRRLFPATELGTVFNGNNVKTFDDEKIKREHRKNTDLRRWFATKKVDSVNDKHAIRFTHRLTANAPIHYYAMDIIIDSKTMAGHPFYVEQLLRRAIDKLGLEYPETQYQLEIFTSNIDITWDNKTVSIDVYRDNQSKYPASVDKQPLLIYPELMVQNYVTYGANAGWNLRVTAEAEAERAARKEKCGDCKRS